MKTVSYFFIAIVAASVCMPANAESQDRQKVTQAPQTVGAGQDPGCISFDTASLTMKSDFTVFLQQTCPVAVRNDALRKLWRLLPQTSNTDLAF